MANFPLLRALGWAFRSRLLSAEMQEIDARLTKVPNAAEGSSHVATGVVKITGAGAEIEPLVSTDFDGQVHAGKAIHWYSGSTLLVDAGTTATVRSTLTIDGTTGGAAGRVEWTNGAVAELKSGAGLNALSGAVAAFFSGSTLWQKTGGIGLFQGNTTIADGGTGGTNGRITLGSNVTGHGSIRVTAYGDITVLDSGVVSVKGGGDIAVAGSHTNPATITLTGDGAFGGGGSLAGAMLKLVSFAMLTVDSTSAILCAGELVSSGSLTVSGSALQTGPWTRSGNGATTAIRRKTLPSTNGATFTASEAEVWVVPTGLGSGTPYVVTMDCSETFSYSFEVVQGDPNTQGRDLIVNSTWGGGTNYIGVFAATSTGLFMSRGAVRCYYSGGSQLPRIVGYFDGKTYGATSPYTGTVTDQLFYPGALA